MSATHGPVSVAEENLSATHDPVSGTLERVSLLQVLDSVMRERVPVTQGPVSVIRESRAMALTQALVYVTLETVSMTQVHLVCDSWISL